MRALKFRAWDKRFDRMLEWSECESAFTLFWLNNGLMGGHVIMQYTGLRDSVGVEIYDGDLLRDQDAQLWKIKWSDWPGRWSWNDLGRSGIPEVVSDEHAPGTHFEVVGNIYANPELLK